MATLYRHDMQTLLRSVRIVQTLTDGLRATVRPPTAQELYAAVGAIAVIHDLLLRVCVTDVEVEALPCDGDNWQSAAELVEQIAGRVKPL